MVKPSTQDLYLLQNEHGLIKVGRSKDVGERLAKLRQSERCAIQFVTRFRRSGHYEEGAHFNLRKYRLIGEWFCGSEAARAAIEGEFGLTAIEWPFHYDAAAAATWIAHMKDVRYISRLRKAISRETTILRRADEPHLVHDLSIFCLMQHPMIDKVGEIEMHMVAGELTRLHRDRASGALRPIPAYTSDVEAALGVWPDGKKPVGWGGSALDCCIAGLAALNAGFR